MDTQEKHSRGSIGGICLYLAPILSVVLQYFLERETVQTLFSNGIFMVVLSSGFLLFMRTSGKELFGRIEHHILFWGCFTLSFLLLGMHSIRSVGMLWLLVVAFAGMEVGLELSVSLHIFLMTAYVILVLLAGGDLYAFAVTLLFGFILATLFSLYRSKQATLYLAVILLAVDGVLQFVLYRFNMGDLLAHGGQIAVEMAGILALVLLGRCFLRFAPHLGQESHKDSLEKLMEQDFPLMQELQSFSGELYQHSQRVADLSGRAADVVGGDVMLARAGGFYHEIGRIAGEENYIEAGMALGEQYSFPEELQAVIRQHSPSYELPKSTEAAVVMLSDCILSTSDYLMKNGMREKLADEKLVHNVFQNRLSKGNLKESGMTLRQVDDLQAYFIAHAFEKGV